MQLINMGVVFLAASQTDTEPREQPQAESEEKPAETKGVESVDSTKLTTEGDESVSIIYTYQSLLGLPLLLTC